VADDDIWHALRNATNKINMDEDLTMLIGPARNGTPLEIGVLGLGGDAGGHPRHAATPQVLLVHQPRKAKAMKYTDAQIEEAARRFEQLADQLDPATAEVEDLSDLRAIAEAAEQVRRDEALVTERVAAARARGRSWNRIAVALGVSRQAARHRFASKLG
jgi:hypothetical protein